MTEELLVCDQCHGTLFTLKWVLGESAAQSGLFRCCAGCGQLSAILAGHPTSGELIFQAKPLRVEHPSIVGTR